MEKGKIILKGVRVHNLKNVDLTLTAGNFIVFTGVSGSGKSSLAFDTIFLEGQRRYIESLSIYARRHLGEMAKPDADSISGISPTIAIEQKTAGKNPRSTVGTMTGIYDFLRVLYARVATAYCPVSGEPVSPQSEEQIIRRILSLKAGSKILILAPYAREKKGEFKEDFAELMKKGFTRLRVDGKIVDLGEEFALDGKINHNIDLVIDRVVVSEKEKERIAESTIRALEEGKGIISILNGATGEEFLFSKFAYSPKSGLSYSPLEPQDFSFNHPAGMCPSCEGLGTRQEFILDKIINPNLSIAEDCCSVASSYKTVRYGNIYDNLARIFDFKVSTPWKKLSEKAKRVFLYGTEKKWTKMVFSHPHKRQNWTEYVGWKGVLWEARQKFQEAKSDHYKKRMEELMESSLCSECKGAKIRPYPAAAKLGTLTISELTSLPIQKCLTFFQKLKLFEEKKIIAVELLKEIKSRLSFLEKVGLHYLTLDRTSPTLSGGEAQRVRLASQIGSGLSHATYILDEPSIGLHPRDNGKLIDSLKQLSEKENTVIVVEHDEEMMRSADEIVDVGPYAGENGGEIVAQGSIKDIMQSNRSITGKYLSSKLVIPIPKKRRTLPKSFLIIRGAEHHNLKKIDVKIPLQIFTAVTGLSGSGKSSLITDILFPALSNLLHQSKLSVGKHKKIEGVEGVDKVIAIDQSPIGRTPRSNPATYIKLFDDIRELFSSLPESRAFGYKSGQFSFNAKEGSCPQCGGMGMIKIDMDFMEDEWMTCQVCEGKRFDLKTLSVSYKGKNINDILNMSVSEALEFFSSIPKIARKLQFLMEVGLDYLKLGQTSPTLSGGEAQRIKLARELSRPSKGNTLYILDEPTTGLHFYDIQKLLHVLQKLVDQGNTLVVIEHNMDLVKNADWIIDLGPEGGEEGGKIIGEGRPERIAKQKTPTGVALRKYFAPSLEIKLKKKKEKGKIGAIQIEGASQNNLKNITVSLPHGAITVCTGPSGSGKTSFAFETVFAESERRYLDSLSTYSRQFLKQMAKPKLENAAGLMAPIAIEQKSHAGNPRSTVGTMTEIYDYLRLLFAHLGTAYCPETKEPIRTISKGFVLERLAALPPKTKLTILAPLKKPKETFADLKARLLKEGFLRIRLDQADYELDQDIPFDPLKKQKLALIVDRLVIGKEEKKRLFEAIDLATKIAEGTMVASYDNKEIYFNLSFAVESTGKSYPPITPHTFSFNTAHGMCESCLGLGFQYGINFKKYPAVLRLSPIQLISYLWKEHANFQALDFFEMALKELHINPDLPLQDFSDEEMQAFLKGGKEESWSSKKKVRFKWKGLNEIFADLAKSVRNFSLRQAILALLEEHVCPSCQGARLNPLARNVLIDHLSIADVCSLPIEKAISFIDSLDLQEKMFLKDPLNQLKQRLHFIQMIGLGYLSLNRSAPTLSGGEAQRISLARQLGSGLTGCLYILDEPTIGLHPQDNMLLNDSLQRLKDLGNTLLLVEHDPLTIATADYLIDFGPAAGKEGGKIIAKGSVDEIKENPHSLTGLYLSGRKSISIPKKRRFSKEFLSIRNGTLHNLKNISVDIPIGSMTCITGVSGSGKSTLIHNLLKSAIEEAFLLKEKKISTTYLGAKIEGFHHFSKLIVIDQNPIGHTIRADVSTYVDLLTPLRYLFASLPASKMRGLIPRHFSFNHKKGMCSSCFGLGTKSIQMQFLPPVKVVCDSCHGFRLNPLSLEIKFKGKHLGEILKMNVEEAKAFLPEHPQIQRILETLIMVGLGYLQLDQEIVTLSGGEAQRIRLSRELAKKSRGKILYLFDEPTIGLHSLDIEKILPIFHSLVDKGNTIIFIEHNLDMIANADYIIDLGPEAGDKGGELVIAGTPEEVALCPYSYTSKFLKNTLSK